MDLNKSGELGFGNVNHAFEDQDMSGKEEEEESAHVENSSYEYSLQDDEHVYANVAEIARREEMENIDRFVNKCHFTFNLFSH